MKCNICFIIYWNKGFMCSCLQIHLHVFVPQDLYVPVYNYIWYYGVTQSPILLFLFIILKRAEMWIILLIELFWTSILGHVFHIYVFKYNFHMNSWIILNNILVNFIMAIGFRLSSQKTLNQKRTYFKQCWD